jgi:peptidoglycan/xylan/chitin deacetylase (PgdA/CDA1 family)
LRKIKKIDEIEVEEKKKEALLRLMKKIRKILQAFLYLNLVILFLLLFFLFLPGDLHPDANNKKQIIILKADDFVFSEKWARFITYIENKNIKVSLGVVGKQLNNESLCDWIKLLSSNNNIEFWNHGLTHESREFKGSHYEYQLAHLQETQRLFKDECGIIVHTFGAPGNEIDETTSQALTDIEEIKIWLYGKTDSVKLRLERKGEIESPIMHPNYNEFINRYNGNRLDQYEYLALQMHPGFWDDKGWEEFEKIIDFLEQKEVVFMTPFGYYQSVTETYQVTNNSSSGPGTLRAAIDQANNDNLKDAVIILPAGTYYLSGTSGEDNNAGGDLDIKSNITIQGAGPDSTIIDGNHNDRVFHVSSGRVLISGVTIRHGEANWGGGIRVDGGTFAVRNCIITGNATVNRENQETGGGGIYVQDAKAIISNCTITNNAGNSAAGVKGGGISINHTKIPKRVDTRNCLIEGNIANTNNQGTGWGGGLYLSANSPGCEVILFNNICRNNNASSEGEGDGGGLYLRDAANVNLERNRFIENVAPGKGNGRGGAIFAAGGENFHLSNNLLVNNNAGSAGGGIYLNGYLNAGQVKTIACTMLHNTLADNNRGNGGEGIYAGDYVSLTLTNNLMAGHTTGIYNNTAAGTSTITADTNLFHNISDPVKGTNAQVGDPLLTAEFKPMENSPAVDAGKTINTVTNDLEGISRPQGNGYDIGCYEYLSTPYPVILLDKTLFNFAGSGSHVTDSQLLRISNGGPGILNWTAEPGEPWLQVSPTSGSSPGNVTITVNPTGLSPGTVTGTIIITAGNAHNSPQIVKVNMTVYKPGSTGAPFGYFETPADKTTGITGSIPVTGWALDDIQVNKLEIYLKQGKELVFIGNAVFIEGARPDVEQAYPTYPFNYQAGWGYLLLTNFLPDQGNGTFTLHAVAVDNEGNHSTLGTKTITCDNAHAVKPFGAVDTPDQGGTVSGKQFANWGWVLTPQPNSIPIDGSTINVWVNGVNLGHPTYNIHRADIADLFPGYFNSNGACGYFYLNTSKYENGMHTIFWSAEDSAGNKEGIGSRYFFIQNQSGLYSQPDSAASCQKKVVITDEDFNHLPEDLHTPIWLSKGYRENVKPQRIYPGGKGITYIKLKELERIEIRVASESSVAAGYMPVGHQLRPLPIGSTLDTQTKTFYWLPGPGFVGTYRLSFILKDQDGEMRRIDLMIEIMRS